MSEERATEAATERRWTDWLKKPDFWIVLLPLIYYVVMIRVPITFGDGPELLVAMHQLGNAHPSGYPLFTVLGIIPSQIPWPSEFWNVAVLLSAIPGAFAIWAIYRFLQTFDIDQFPAAIAALAYGMNWHVSYQATRIEVYALHCLLIGLSLLALAKFMNPRKRDEPHYTERSHDLKWAYLCVLFACLALTNHLTSVFLVVPVTLGMILAAPRKILNPKTIAKFFGIAIGCASIYLYLPISALANDGYAVSWNDPETLKQFWFHVSGQEYSIFRSTDMSKFLPTAEKFWDATNNSFFPGIIVICGIGIYEWFVRHWKSMLCVLLFELPYLAYVATYQINDISTYFTGLFIPIALTFGFGLDWLFRMRFKLPEYRGVLDHALEFIVVVGVGAWIVGLGWNARTHAYREALAEDMSAFVMEDVEEPAFVFTSVDGHTFPMWYQAYMNQPTRDVIVVDTVMFHLKNKQWYRDHLKQRHPNINWPDNDIAFGNHWRQWLLDNNPDINAYALLQNRWPEMRSYPVLKGWHHEIIRGTEEKKEEGERLARHMYVAYQGDVPGSFFHNSKSTYVAGKERIACVAEWWKHTDFVGKWRFIGPNGERHEFNNHKVPENSNLSWEYLTPAQQTPGEWRCEIEAPRNPLMVQEFTITEP